MKKPNIFTFLTGIFSIVFLLSACDKMEEDTRPQLLSKLYLQNDAYTTSMNQGIQIQVLANDSVQGSSSVTFNQPRNGNLQPTGSPGSAFYQPSHNFIGKDTINYQVCLSGNCISAKAIITVQPDSVTNPCTVALVNDTAGVYANQTSHINILQNDISCNQKPVISQHPQNGQASINSANQLVYTPNPNYTGLDMLFYRIGNQIAPVEIRVKPVVPNCTLSALPDMVNMPHTQPFDSIAINVLANDTWCSNAGQPSINLVSQSSHGSLVVVGSGANLQIVYMTATPLRNITDNFQYRLCQGNVCSTTTVTVNIQ